ncbi:unnamed protein product [Pleuronectes platessa]|uniref:Uncharacterized protein n=1 Tax=Pleuronectes platessa TaxID=8262 RepID=A0A9N7U5T6_PLEPL|nr:unnamed protein product [Pleuronectes platessa]
MLCRAAKLHHRSGFLWIHSPAVCGSYLLAEGGGTRRNQEEPGGTRRNQEEQVTLSGALRMGACVPAWADELSDAPSWSLEQHASFSSEVESSRPLFISHLLFSLEEKHFETQTKQTLRTPEAPAPGKETCGDDDDDDDDDDDAPSFSEDTERKEDTGGRRGGM